MSTQAPEVPSTIFAHDHAPLIVGGSYNDALNHQLFGEAPSVDLPFPELSRSALRERGMAEVAIAVEVLDQIPEVPQKAEAQNIEKPVHWWRRTDRNNHRDSEPTLLNSEGLVREITSDAISLREQAERDGMSQPHGVIIGGLSYGERKADLLETVLDFADTGVVRSPYGDTTSYQRSLLAAYKRAGIQPVLYVAREVAQHPDTLALLDRLGLDPAVTFGKDHDLGGVLQDLAAPVVERRQLTNRRVDYLRVRDQLVQAGSVEGFTEVEVRAEIDQISRELPQLDKRLAQLEATIDARLAEEDAKIQAITEREMGNKRTASVINMLPIYTDPGAQAIRQESYTDNLKDIDGLSLHWPRDQRRWDEITANAALCCAEYFSKQPIAILRNIMTIVGADGRLVGKRMSEKADPSVAIKGREAIISYAQNPGDAPTGVVLTAVPAAEIIKADRIRPARWGGGVLGLLERRRLLIIDAGVASVTNPVTGARETRGNIDLASLARAQNKRWGLRKARVEATGPENGVGPGTSALAALRTMIAATETFYAELGASTDGAVTDATEQRPRELMATSA